jgi:integrase
MGYPSDRPDYAAPPRPTLLSVVRERLRVKHYSLRTEQAYVAWVRRFVAFHGRRHPRELGAPEVEAFLSDLAVRRQVSAATQNQALAALLFLYREVLGISLPWLDGITRAKRPEHVPTVLSTGEMERLFTQLEGTHRLIARLLYGSGMRLMECVRSLWRQDREASVPGVELPLALERKYPAAGREWGWFWVFPARALSRDPRTGIVRRHHTHEQALQRASSARSPPRASSSRRPPTPCGTRSPPTCCRLGTTSAPSRSCSGIGTSARRWSTRTF